MRAGDISSIIASDLDKNPGFFNSHGLDVGECLVHPHVVEFDDSFSEGKTVSLWLVLKERRGGAIGYLVVYSEERNMFGLATYSAGRPIFLGFYGSFTETLSGM